MKPLSKSKTFSDFLINDWFHMLLELQMIKDKVATNTRLTYLILGAVVASVIGRAVF